ncbi:nucleotide modification associated domain-containing protein [Brochothrix thermosphacta]|uniref:nucleotide modification associated domain-containing protein n=1 Tax=Brochothrix thermosphacta TaxID=2756 RepID=UPI001C404BE2|nr:nucleotide modification associated domain-containing protein [Brochothrix thermosphacta]
MIHEGKEYKEVLNSEVRTGDLLIVFKLNHAVLSKNKYLKYTSAVHSKEDLVLIAKNHSDMLVELSSNHDGWRTYRYVKDVEETSVPKEQNVPLAHANKIQELVQRAATTPAALADVISAAQRRALKGTPNDAIDAMRYGFEKLGKTLKRPTLSENINDLFTEIKDIIVAKNENYGDSFSKQYQKYGMISVEMRLNDKFMRLEQLVAGEKDKVGESIEDTLKDIIGYATLALIELESEQNKH